MMISTSQNDSYKMNSTLLPQNFFDNIDLNDSNQNRAVNVRLLCGGDLLESFAIPGLWSDDDVSISI